jgi:hypothetical protein
MPEENRSNFSFHWLRIPEHNRTKQKQLLSMSNDVQRLSRREQNRTEQKQLAFPLGENA